jgi:hypothetical protein
VAEAAHSTPRLETRLRIALLTFVLLAGIGVALGHAARHTAQPRIDDHAGTVRLKL